MKAMTNQQRDYALGRAKSTKTAKEKAIKKECLVCKDTVLSPADIQEAFISGCDFSFKKNAISNYQAAELRRIFDLSEIEPVAVYSDDMDQRLETLKNDFQHIENQIMLGDAAEALDLILAFEK